MSHLRTVAAMAVVVVLAAACSGTSSSAPQQNLATQSDGESTETVVTEAPPTDQVDGASLPMAIAEAQAVIAEAETYCDELPADRVSDLTAEDLEVTTFTGPNPLLACARLTGIDLSSAVMGPADGSDPEAPRLDLRGADLSGADLRDARMSIDGVAANFAGADLSGADLTDSDLRGANLTGARLVGASLTTQPDGLALANLTNATIGCGVIDMAPGADLTGVTIVDDCGQSPAYYDRLTLRGSMASVVAPGFDFGSVVVEVTDFRRAVLTGADLSDKGPWPSGSDFTGADLANADLSGTGFIDTSFAQASMAGAALSETYWRDVVASGADLSDGLLTGVTFERVVLTDASLVRVDLSDGLLDRVTLLGTPVTDSVRTDLVLRDVICPDGTPTVDNAGSCDINNRWEPAPVTDSTDPAA